MELDAIDILLKFHADISATCNSKGKRQTNVIDPVSLKQPPSRHIAQ